MTIDFHVSQNYWIGYPFTIGKSYQDTHKINYYNECRRRAGSDREMAFCYGSEVHGIEDSYSHNNLIPSRITATGLPNIIIHPITELVVDGVYFTPKIQQIYTLEALEYVDPETGRNLIEFGNSFWGKDMTSRVKLLSAALGSETAPGLWGGYGLPVQEDSQLFSVYQAAIKGNLVIGLTVASIGALLLVLIIKRDYGKWEYLIGFFMVMFFIFGLLFSIGISRMGSPHYATPHLDDAKEQVRLFMNHGVGPTMDPSGASALKTADGPVFLKDLAIIGVISFIVIIVRKVVFKKKK